MHELNQHKIAALLPQRRAQSNNCLLYTSRCV